MGVNTLDEPLWYTASFPESSWIRDWQTLVRRYRNNPAVIGVDLRNEPHTVGSSPWTLNDYLHRGATWGPYNGVDNPATDWRLAAERGGNAVLAVNPHLLVIVEGIGVYPDAGSPNGVESSWWSGLLTPVRRYPVVLSVPHRLVYSVHEWGPVKWPMAWFRHMTYAGLVRAWHHAWAYLLDQPSAPYAAPVLLGEFGTCTDRPACYNTHPGGQAAWFASIVRFLREHPALSWSFFALNGTNSNDCATDNGLLTWAWNNLRVPGLQSKLTSAGAATHHVPGLGGPGPLYPGTGTRARPRSSRSPLCTLP
jgi:endoglucanase